RLSVHEASPPLGPAEAAAGVHGEIVLRASSQRRDPGEAAVRPSSRSPTHHRRRCVRKKRKYNSSGAFRSPTSKTRRRGMVIGPASSATLHRRPAFAARSHRAGGAWRHRLLSLLALTLAVSAAQAEAQDRLRS